MYKQIKHNRGTIIKLSELTGETIETKVNRIVNNKEPIKDGAPAIYTDRKEGVIPAYNIKSDRFEIATDAMDIVSKTNIAKRASKAGEVKVIDMTIMGEAQTIQGTEQK